MAEVRRWLVRNETKGTIVATEAERAGDGAARRKGLLGRTEFPAGSGLLIEPCEGVHTFFMKFPIDVVHLDKKLRVRKLRHNVGPWRISLCLSGDSVLELPSGTAAAARVERGDQLRLERLV